MDPRPTLYVVREGAGLEIRIRDEDMHNVVLALGPADQVEGQLHRTEHTGVDVVQGQVQTSNQAWVDARPRRSIWQPATSSCR